MSVRAVNTDPITICGVPERAKGVQGDDVHIAISSGHIGASHNRTQRGVRFSLSARLGKHGSTF
jgi:hypothetical protein